MAKKNKRWRRTTILAVRHQEKIAIGGDGQVTVGATVMKSDALKVRRLLDGRVIVGFAGATADAFALLERYEAKLRDFQGNIPRAATELAKEWRMDKSLRRLEAMLVSADAANMLLISGTGDVVTPSDGILGIGSGGPFAVAAARALVNHSNLDAKGVVTESLNIAGDICIYTNQHLIVEEIDCKQ